MLGIQGEKRVAGLAIKLLETPSRRLSRQLISMQNDSGAFLEPNGTKASTDEQALALLALVKAKSMYGADMDDAIQKAWAYLKSVSPIGINCKEAIARALKGTKYWNDSNVKRELEALSDILERL
jgi:hypothetical protein